MTTPPPSSTLFPYTTLFRSKVPVLAQKTRLPPKRRNHPDVAAQRVKLGPDRRSDLDHPGAGGACGDKGNPVSVGREGRLDVLPRVVGDVYVLASVDATHVNLEIPAAIGGKCQETPVRRPGG